MAQQSDSERESLSLTPIRVSVTFPEASMGGSTVFAHSLINSQLVAPGILQENSLVYEVNRSTGDVVGITRRTAIVTLSTDGKSAGEISQREEIIFLPPLTAEVIDEARDDHQLKHFC